MSLEFIRGPNVYYRETTPSDLEDVKNALVEMIAGKEKEKDFDILITELNEKIRQRKLKIENSVGYLVGVYQKKGILIVKN